MMIIQGIHNIQYIPNHKEEMNLKMKTMNRRHSMSYIVLILTAFLMVVSSLASIGASAASTSYKTWNDVVDAMDKVIDDAKTSYQSGDADAAYKGINSAYYDYYEVTGFERITMGSISGSRKSEMELQFSACKAIAKKNGSKDSFDTEADKLKSMLREDANKLDGVSGNSTKSDSEESNSADETASSASTGLGGGSGIVVFSACFGIILREGLEAILVVGAIIAYLVKSGHKNQLKVIYIGCVLAVIASFVCAWLLDLLKLANSANQEVIEGITALIAVVVLFYVSNWMVSKAESEAWTKYIDDKVRSSAEMGSAFTLGFTAFLAVFREGAEVILFYQPYATDSESTGMMWLGFGVGCVVLVGVFLAIRFFSVKLPLRPFFLGTSILMFIMSISFLGAGIKELIEGDVIMMTSPDWLSSIIPTNDLFDVLGVYPCLETIIPQLILVAITFMIFVMQKWKRNNKNEAGILAVLFGGVGMHKFYTGKYGQGILYIIFCWSFVPAILGVMEGIHYLTETQEQFEEELKPKKKTRKPKEPKNKEKKNTEKPQTAKASAK